MILLLYWIPTPLNLSSKKKKLMKSHYNTEFNFKNSLVFANSIIRPTFWHSVLKHHLQHKHPKLECQFRTFPLNIPSSSLLTQQWRLLVLTWPSLSLCSHLGSETVDGGSHSLSLFAFQINKIYLLKRGKF